MKDVRIWEVAHHGNNWEVATWYDEDDIFRVCAKRVERVMVVEVVRSDQTIRPLPPMPVEEPTPWVHTTTGQMVIGTMCAVFTLLALTCFVGMVASL
jgi:hypothetical protein